MLYNLQTGQDVFNKKVLTDSAIRKLTYSHETAQFGGGFPVSTHFRIAEIDWSAPQKAWVLLEASTGEGERHLKVSKRELEANFKTSRG